MTNLFDGISNIVQGIFQSIFALIQGFFGLIWSLVHGIFAFAFGLVQTLANFVGGSVQFVFSNIIVIGVLALAFVIYRDRQARGGSKPALGQKKVA